MPLALGKVKFNFDAAFKDGITFIRVILRNESYFILGVQTNSFVFSKLYCAEIEAAVQALKIADELGIKEVVFEGDVAYLILALQGLEEYDDWCAISNLSLGHHILANNHMWFVNCCPRTCNECAHNLAIVGNSVKFFGLVPIDLLPDFVKEADL